MTQAVAIKFNKRCAEFIGAVNWGRMGFTDSEYYQHEFFKRTEWSNKHQDNVDVDIYSTYSMLFHLDWNWIKLVIDKIISGIGVKTVDECTDEEWFQITRITQMYIGVDISTAAHYVNEYLIWYNKEH